MVLGMFALLFRPGAFDLADPSPNVMVMILFWIAFEMVFARRNDRKRPRARAAESLAASESESVSRSACNSPTAS